MPLPCPCTPLRAIDCTCIALACPCSCHCITFAWPLPALAHARLACPRLPLHCTCLPLLMPLHCPCLPLPLHHPRMPLLHSFPKIALALHSLSPPPPPNNTLPSYIPKANPRWRRDAINPTNYSIIKAWTVTPSRFYFEVW